MVATRAQLWTSSGLNKLGDHTSSKVKTTSDLYPLFKQSVLQVKHFLKPVSKIFQDPFSNNLPQHISALVGWSGVFGRHAANLCNIACFADVSWHWNTSKTDLRTQKWESQQIRNDKGGGGALFGTYVCGIALDAIILDFRAGLGFRGGCWLRGPVRVHTKFLGQMHVPSLGCHLANAAQPGQTLGRMLVNALLKVAQPRKETNKSSEIFVFLWQTRFDMHSMHTFSIQNRDTVTSSISGTNVHAGTLLKKKQHGRSSKEPPP